jgi:hypothetical protein
VHTSLGEDFNGRGGDEASAEEEGGLRHCCCCVRKVGLNLFRSTNGLSFEEIRISHSSN